MLFSTFGGSSLCGGVVITTAVPTLAVLLLVLFTAVPVSADIMVFSNSTGHPVEVEFRDMPARFGDPIPPEGIEVMIVYANPPNGCKEIQRPPIPLHPNLTRKWAVLIARCGCNFDTKVRNAQNATYDIAIVHNINSSELEPMSSEDPSGIHIPSVFVGSLTGKLLKEHYQYYKDYYVLINSDSPFDINTHLLLPFGIVVGLCFCVMLGFMVIKCIKDQRRARRHRLPTSSLRKIPTAKFHKGDPYETCAICLDDYVEGDKLRILPCSHAYHSKCVDPWLTCNRRVCPVCKRKVFAADEVPPPGSTSDSDSDTDIVADDTTPLMQPNQYQTQTQGGTFNNPLENPLSRRNRDSGGRPFWRRHSFFLASSSSSGESVHQGGGEGEAAPAYLICPGADHPEPCRWDLLDDNIPADRPRRSLVGRGGNMQQSPHDADCEDEDDSDNVGEVAVEVLPASRVIRSGSWSIDG